MKKKFILWLCRILKVDLVDPINQVTNIKYVHEKLPYTQIIDQIKVSENDLRYHGAHYDLKLRMQQRLLTKIEPLIEWEQFTDPMTRELNVRARLFVANPKNS